MRNLLDRGGLLRGWGPSAPVPSQPYHVVCPQGHPLRGMRTKGIRRSAVRPAARESSCCRQPLARPPPPRPPRPRPRKPALEDDGGRDDMPIALTDPPEMQDVGDPSRPARSSGSIPARLQGRRMRHGCSPGGTDPDPIPTTRRARDRSRIEGETTGMARARSPSRRRRPSRPPEEDGRGRPAAVAGRASVRSRLATPGGTGPGDGGIDSCSWAWGSWSSARSRSGPGGRAGKGSREVAERGRTQGLEALEAGKFDAAHQLLSEASRAVDAMGGASRGRRRSARGPGRPPSTATWSRSRSSRSSPKRAGPSPWSGRRSSPPSTKAGRSSSMRTSPPSRTGPTPRLRARLPDLPGRRRGQADGVGASTRRGSESSK